MCIWLGCKVFSGIVNSGISQLLAEGNMAGGEMIMGTFIGIGTAMHLVIGLDLKEPWHDRRRCICTRPRRPWGLAAPLPALAYAGVHTQVQHPHWADPYGHLVRTHTKH